MCPIQDEDAQNDARLQDREIHNLGRVLRGQYARSASSGLLSARAPAARLLLDGRSLQLVDAFGGVVVRAVLDQHVAVRGNSVSVLEPESATVWQTLYDLLGRGNLPAGCSWGLTRSPARRGDCVLVPATPLASDQDVRSLIDLALPGAAAGLGHGGRPARLAQESAALFTHNARTHGSGSPVPPLLCASFDEQSKDLQVVVFDRGAALAGGNGAALREAIARSRASGGGLASLAAYRRRGCDFSVRLAGGAGRARYDSRNRKWKFSDVADLVPGFMAALEIHR